MEEGRDIDFDRAKYGAKEESGSASAAPCAHCKQPMQGAYWKVQAQAVCKQCRDKVSDLLGRASSGKSLGSAALMGGLAALGCGIAYAVFVDVTNYQIAFATIGIALVVARVVRKASGGVGGPRFQVLAVALTYFASTMGYAPPVVKAAMEVEHVDYVRALGYILAGPFLELSESPLGLVIVAIGLWQAWKLTREVPIAIEGPFELAPKAGPLPGT